MLFQDETKLCLGPDPGRDYHRPGQQTRVPSPGQATARWLFGTIDVAGGEGRDQAFDRATSAEFLRHLDDLRQLFPAEQLLLAADQASYHDSDAVRDFRAHVGDRLAFIPLPTHSPRLNAIERLRGYLRDHVTRGIFWGTLPQVCAAAVAFLDAPDFATFQRLMSTSPLFTNFLNDRSYAAGLGAG